MNRFFIDEGCIENGVARILGEDVKHIARVLRLSVGDEVTLCGAQGMEYTAQIESLERETVYARILDANKNAAEPACAITLYQGLPKAGKLELVIQKCVELGVTRIVPVAAARSVVKTTKKDFEQKLTRYNRVAYEAAKQSRRGIVPAVSSLVDFSEVDWSGYDLVIVADEEEKAVTLKSVLRRTAPQPQSIAVVIGPEGGLERREVEGIRFAGGVGVTLGRRILRTESAGMAVVAMILYELEG